MRQRRPADPDRRPTILIANPSADVYGSDLQLLESISALTAHYRVVVAIPSDGPLVPMIRERGGQVELLDFPVLRRANQSVRAFAGLAWSALSCLPRLLRFVRGVAPEVVYVNTVTLPWWLLVARLARRPTVVHLHEAENTDGGLVQRALILPLRLAHAIIVISRSAMTAMADVDAGLVDRARLIYNGVPQPPEEPVPARRQGPIRLIVVGRLSPRKAPHLALEAAGRLRSRGQPVEIKIAGSAFEGYEWYVAELEKRARAEDLLGAVTFAGYCKPIWPHLAAADIVIAPSLREPFGNAVVEAQLALRPVVATAALGHLESIRDQETGLLVPPEDVEAMVQAVSRLIEDGEFSSQLAERARSNALTLFSTQRYQAEILSLIGSCRGRG